MKMCVVGVLLFKSLAHVQIFKLLHFTDNYALLLSFVAHFIIDEKIHTAIVILLIGQFNNFILDFCK